MKINGIHEIGHHRTRTTWEFGISMWLGFTQRELAIQIGHRRFYFVLNGGRGRV